MRTVLAATDPGGVLRQALDAIDALEAERDALTARVAQHERGVASWLAEEALWKEREAALVARVRELEAALRDLLDEITIVIDHPAWRRYELAVKPLRDDDPVDAARRALEGAGDAREG